MTTTMIATNEPGSAPVHYDEHFSRENCELAALCVYGEHFGMPHALYERLMGFLHEDHMVVWDVRSVALGAGRTEIRRCCRLSDNARGLLAELRALRAGKTMT
jgi:hypothetical protein